MSKSSIGHLQNSKVQGLNYQKPGASLFLAEGKAIFSSDDEKCLSTHQDRVEPIHLVLLGKSRQTVILHKQSIFKYLYSAKHQQENLRNIHPKT